MDYARDGDEPNQNIIACLSFRLTKRKRKTYINRFFDEFYFKKFINYTNTQTHTYVYGYKQHIENFKVLINLFLKIKRLISSSKFN
jgi:hypothetical protein